MDQKQKKMLMIAGAVVAVVILVVVVLHIRKKSNESKKSITFEEIDVTPKLASFDELLALGYSDTEAKQIMASESYKQGIKNY